MKFEVPDDLKSKLLLPFLSKKARTFTARLSFVQLDDYEFVKDFVLNQLSLRRGNTKHASIRLTRGSADADNRLDAFSGQSRSTNMVPFHM